MNLLRTTEPRGLYRLEVCAGKAPNLWLAQPNTLVLSYTHTFAEQSTFEDEVVEEAHTHTTTPSPHPDHKRWAPHGSGSRAGSFSEGSR